MARSKDMWFLKQRSIGAVAVAPGKWGVRLLFSLRQDSSREIANVMTPDDADRLADQLKRYASLVRERNAKEV